MVLISVLYCTVQGIICCRPRWRKNFLSFTYSYSCILSSSTIIILYILNLFYSLIIYISLLLISNYSHFVCESNFNLTVFLFFSCIFYDHNSIGCLHGCLLCLYSRGHTLLSTESLLFSVLQVFVQHGLSVCVSLSLIFVVVVVSEYY